MKKSNERLIEGINVPLLEQEKINDIFCGGHEDVRMKARCRRQKMIITFLASTVAVLIISILVILSSNLRDNTSLGNDGTDGAESTEKPVTDVGAGATDTHPVDTEDSSVNKEGGGYEYDFSAVPDGHMPIVPADLSSYEKGASYIINLTGLMVNTNELLGVSLKNESNPEMLTSSTSPKVLIVHTHGRESYNIDGGISYEDNGGEFMMTDDTSKSVISLGEYLTKLLNENNVPTVHCSVIHDNVQYKDSFLRSESTIREYLARYPSIKLVIDLHRDSIINSEGHIIRPVSFVDGKATAQIQCIVGSSWGGEECPNWQGNLSLAIKLRERLNAQYTNICRPPELRALSYNQELAPYSIMIEIGSFGNSLGEAKVAVECISDALSELIAQI